MKPKKLRRFIRETVKSEKSILYQDLLSRIWTHDSNTPIKRIERAINKMNKWGQLLIITNRRTNEIYIRPPVKDNQ